MAWTNEQIDAIYKSGCNIIVSAGAGSGKTAVLSERILEKCKNNTDIRRVLVLTFTKAAAEEMKERIRKKLIDNNLIVQSNYIDSAYITTFDSYSLSLVKKYYYRLGINKDVSIMDSAMIQIKRNEIIDHLFNKYYIGNEPKFCSFLERLCYQDDKEFKKMVNCFSQKLELLIDYNEFVDKYHDEYLSKSKIDSIVDSYEKLLFENICELKKQLNELLNAINSDSASIKMFDSLNDFYKQLDSASSYEEYYFIMNSYTFPRTSPKASELVKEIKNNVKDFCNKIRDNYLSKYSSKEQMIDELIKTGNDVLLVLDIARNVNNLLYSYKKEVGRFDYSDIARLAIKLVTEYEDIKNEVRDSYDEILVDEYQDTSDIQEYFLSQIENNNRYMVGDIKQSIYRFRNANPYIFKEKYDNYSKNIGGLKIDLTYNFRSREEVLNNINSIFNIVMTNECGDADYITSHQMKYGQKLYDDAKYFDYNMDALSYDEIDGYSNEEIEAFLIAKSIKEVMDANSFVLKGNKYVPVKYSDFAILIDKSKNFTTFKRILEYLHIPVSIEADLDMKDSIIPKLFSNIVILINGYKNKKYDTKYKHAKVSLARSFIYQYDDELIYRMNNLGIVTQIDEDLKYLTSLDLNYSQLFYEICNRLDIYKKLPLIGNVDESMVILESVFNLFNSFNNLLDFNDVLKYLESLFDSDIALPYKITSSSSDSVRIMTIHKSKGLEFAYCYFPMLFSKFNNQDEIASYGLDLEYGAYIPYIENGKSDTILKLLIANKINKADISEKVRLLYVALTRTREKMFLIVPNIEGKAIFRSFYDMLSICNINTKFIDSNQLNLTKNYKNNINKEISKEGKIINYPELFNFNKIERTKISRQIKNISDQKMKDNIELGIKLHNILQMINFNNINLDDLDLDKDLYSIISKVLCLDIFKNAKNANVYHEHEFIWLIDNREYHGIIDLFLEYEDHIDLIDYKLYDVSKSEYIKQLSIYKNYLEGVSSKRVDSYLLSILTSSIIKIEV